MSEQQSDRPETRFRLARDVDYVYRNTFNVYAALDEIVIEFGNLNRAQANEVLIGDRIVLSPSNAMRLQQALQQAFAGMRQQASQGQPDQKTEEQGSTQ